MANDKIDFHCHAIPLETWQLLGEIYPGEFTVSDGPDGAPRMFYRGDGTPPWDLAGRVRDMDACGVEKGILSCPFVYRKLDEHLPQVCTLTNDIYAGILRDAAGRFEALAHLPFNDIDLALREMDRCLDELGFVGVSLASNIGGRYPDEPEFERFWEAVNRRRAPVFLHPIESPCYTDVFRQAIFTYPYDTTLSASRLICGGLFDRYPDVPLILAHMGGVLPFITYRLNTALADDKRHTEWHVPRQWPISVPPREHVRKLYLETGTVLDKGSFDCACHAVGLEHILYGSDTFMPGTLFMGRMNEFLDNLGLDQQTQRMIYRINAERLLAWREANAPVS